MPINSLHAYARGRIYGESRFCSLFSCLGKFFYLDEYVKTQIAWNAFRKHSVMGKDCRFGHSAWCTNYGNPENIRIGSRVYCRGVLRCGTRGSGNIEIGDDVYIGDDSIISSENSISVGRLTLISHGVQIFDSTGHPVDPFLREKDWKIGTGVLSGPRPDVSSRPIVIGERAWIGFNSIIMRGVSIGDNAIVAAGSCVVHDVEPNTVVAGNPARLVKKIGVSES